MDRETARAVALGSASTSLIIGIVVVAILEGVITAVIAGLLGIIILAGLASETDPEK